MLRRLANLFRIHGTKRAGRRRQAVRLPMSLQTLETRSLLTDILHITTQPEVFSNVQAGQELTVRVSLDFQTGEDGVFNSPAGIGGAVIRMHLDPAKVRLKSVTPTDTRNLERLFPPVDSLTADEGDADGDASTTVFLPYDFSVQLSLPPLSADTPLFDAVFEVREGFSGRSNISFTQNTDASATPGFIFTQRSARLQGANTAPVLASISPVTMNEDPETPATVTLNATDADGDSLTFTPTSSNTTLIPNSGLIVSANQLTITPAPNRFGIAQITVVASDGTANVSRTFSVTVNPINDPPVATDRTVSTSVGTAVQIPALTFVSDVDGTPTAPPFLLTVVEQSANGVAVPNSDGTITFSPAADFEGAASFRYRVSDGTIESASATITVNVLRNQPPVVAGLQDVSMNVRGELLLPVNITDAENDSLTITSVSTTPGVVATAEVEGTGAGRRLRLRAGNAPGITQVNLSVSDGINSPVVVSFNVTVSALIDAGSRSPVAGAVNHTGIASGASSTYFSNRPVSGVPDGIPAALFSSLLYGTSPSSPMKFTVPTIPGAAYAVDLFFAETWSGAFAAGRRVFDVSLEGTVVLNDLDIFAQVGANKALVRTFDVTGDGSLALEFGRGVQNPIISGIRVRPQTAPNAAPVISAIAGQTTSEDTPIAAIPFTVTDADGQPLTVSVTSTDSTLFPASGLVITGEGSNRELAITPAQNQFGTANVTVTVADGRTSASSTFAVTVTSANDAPTAVADPAATTLPGSAVVIPVLGNDSDVDSPLNPASITIVEPSANGNAVPNPDGTITFTPAAEFSGITTFRYTVKDTAGAESNPATVTVFVRANSAPQLSSFSEIELNLGTSSSPIAFQISDADGDTLNVSASTSDTSIVSAVTVTGTGNNRQLVVRSGNTVGEATVTVTVSDGFNAPVTKSFKVVVFALIDAGVATPASGTLSDRTFQNGVGRTFAGGPVRITPGSIAASVPEQLFRTVLWDDVGGNELGFDVRAKAGQRYVVDLFFAEIWSGASAQGRRVFDVVLDGNKVLDDFDVFREAGGANIGIARRFEIESDGIIDLDLLHGIQNPAIAGLRVRPVRPN